MLDDVMFLTVSVLVLALAALAKPDRAACPRGWHHQGVRSSGAFSCERNLVGGEDDAPGEAFTARQPPGVLGGRIYCTGGSLPVVVDERTVGCQMGARYQWR